MLLRAKWVLLIYRYFISMHHFTVDAVYRQVFIFPFRVNNNFRIYRYWLLNGLYSVVF